MLCAYVEHQEFVLKKLVTLTNFLFKFCVLWSLRKLVVSETYLGTSY